MKKAIAAVFLFFAIGQAIAACPPYAPYRCVQGYNGKMICGCGV
jgi:hypothetical protein